LIAPRTSPAQRAFHPINARKRFPDDIAHGYDAARTTTGFLNGAHRSSLGIAIEAPDLH
jgi:hypothetical protein